MPLPEGDSSVGHSFGLEFDGVMIKSITEISGPNESGKTVWVSFAHAFS